MSVRTAPRSLLKHALGRGVAMASPQCDFRRAVFLLGHMRCGSTALSHILCSRPEISGYGEAHVVYGGAAPLGRLVINQARRGYWKPSARFLFDKILHNRYDNAAPAAFFGARAIFLVRAPEPAIRSIRQLFTTLGSAEYSDDRAAADYYAARLAQLRSLWLRFDPSRRIGLSYDTLTARTGEALGAISSVLELSPPLANRYTAPTASLAHGVGDPLASHRFDGIVAESRSSSITGLHAPLDLPQGQLDRLTDDYSDFCRSFG